MTHGTDRTTKVYDSHGIQIGNGNTQHITVPGPRQLRVLVSYTDELDCGPAPTYLDVVEQAIQDAGHTFRDASRFRTPAEHDGFDVYVNLVGLLYGPEVHEGRSQPEIAFDAGLRSGQRHFVYVVDNVHLENGLQLLEQMTRQRQFLGRVQEHFQRRDEASRSSLSAVTDSRRLRTALRKDLASLLTPSLPSSRPAPPELPAPSGQPEPSALPEPSGQPASTGGGARQIQPAGVPRDEKPPLATRPPRPSFDWVALTIVVALGLTFSAVAQWVADVGRTLSLGTGLAVAAVTAVAMPASRRWFTKRP